MSILEFKNYAYLSLLIYRENHRQYAYASPMQYDFYKDPIYFRLIPLSVYITNLSLSTYQYQYKDTSLFKTSKTRMATF